MWLKALSPTSNNVLAINQQKRHQLVTYIYIIRQYVGRALLKTSKFTTFITELDFIIMYTLKFECYLFIDIKLRKKLVIKNENYKFQ